MSHSFHIRWAAWALFAFLLAGCAAKSNPAYSARSAGGNRMALTEAPPRLSEDEVERRIRSAAHFALGVSHDLNHRPDLALEAYIEAVEANPRHEPLVLEVARRAVQAQQPEKAIEILKRAKRSRSSSGEVDAWLGLAYAQAGRLDEAITANRAAIKKIPGNLAPYRNLAQVYLQSARLEAALEVLDLAARQQAVELEFLVDLAELLARFAQLQVITREEARPRIVPVLDRAAALEPAEPLMLARIADGYFFSGENGKAERIFLLLLEKEPDATGIHEKLADIYLRTGQREKAARALLAVSRRYPANPQPYLLLASIALEQEDYEKAAEHLSMLLLLQPDMEEVYYELARVKLTLQKPEEALKLLDRARGEFQSNFVMEFFTAISHSLLKNYPDALKHFTSAELLAKMSEPERLTHLFYFQLGAAYERNKNHEEAAVQFKKSLELAPDFADALNYLGYMWADLNIHLEEAREMIERAVELEPENAAFLDSLGWVLFRLNDTEEALDYILKAIEYSDEPDPTLYHHLGDIYEALGDLTLARESWEKALSLDPPDEADEIREKLRALTQNDAPSP